MKLYKILIKKEDKYYSPFQNYCYGTLSEFLNKKMSCDNFDNSNKDCSYGFYATPISGLIYTKLSDDSNKVVFEMEMSGKNINISDYKWRWKYQTFKKLLTLEEVKILVIKESSKMNWNYYDMLFPYNPLQKLTIVTDNHKKLLKQWASVWASVGASVGDSVRDSVGASVRDSVWASVGASVRDSVRASVWTSVRDSVRASVWCYISSGFPNIKSWKYISHEEGVNPFQSCIDLWNDNLVPSFDGEIWRLHSGSKATIVFEITKEELLKL